MGLDSFGLSVGVSAKLRHLQKWWQFSSLTTMYKYAGTSTEKSQWQQNYENLQFTESYNCFNGLNVIHKHINKIKHIPHHHYLHNHSRHQQSPLQDETGLGD